jgi:hypothetical protein
VDKVLKGAWKGKQIEVPDLHTFRKAYSRWSREKGTPILSKQCVVFVSVRHGRPRVVANGVYRVRSDGRVLGYAQEMNPGWYQLQAKPVYAALDELLKDIETAKVKASQKQEALMKTVAIANLDDFRQKLADLERYTCVGDTKVFQFMAEQMSRNKQREEICAYFLQNVPDPAIFPLLKAQYEKTGFGYMPHVMGRQGTPIAREHLAQLVSKKGDSYRREAAFSGLAHLYEALERAGNEVECDRVRGTIFVLFDTRPTAYEHATINPQILAVIPHKGAVERLEKMLARVKGDQSNREYEIQRCLRECRAKIERTTRPFERMTPDALIALIAAKRNLKDMKPAEVLALLGKPNRDPWREDPTREQKWHYSNPRGAALLVIWQKGIVAKSEIRLQY